MWWAAACVLLGLLQWPVSLVHAQEPAPAVDSSQEAPVAIFLDCQNISCDRDFFRTEAAFVTYVRDRQNADLHILITGEPTANGGVRATLDFVGQRRFAGMDDRLQYVALPEASEDQVRQGLVGVLRRGLVRYASRTSVADDLAITYTPTARPVADVPSDPWDAWTFTATANAYGLGEELLGSLSVGLSLSANRVTAASKLTASVSSQYNSSSFDLGAGGRVETVQRNHALTALGLKAIGEHWSLGGRSSLTSSTFLNQSSAVRLAPAVEYNVFPHRESTRRMLTLEYSVGVSHFDYEQETIFGRTSETLFDQRLLTSLQLRQPWGSIGLGAEASHYLHDYRKNRGIVAGNVDWNVARGLSLSVLASVQRIRDQLFLSAQGVPLEEVLTRQRQLATSYSYTWSFGVSYRFGSAYANVVNRRFTGSVGGVSFTQ